MKMLKIAAKGLAGVALAALLAVNVQVGKGVDGWYIVNFGNVKKARAVYCTPEPLPCIIFPKTVVYGYYHDGVPPGPIKKKKS